jgi:hypothetical protein
MIKSKKLLLFISFIALATVSKGQRYAHWNQLVNWNGITHWSQYISYMPATMGPNALPIPWLNQGRIDSTHEFEASFQQSIGDGDLTSNLYGSFRYVIDKKISLVLFGNPIEYYQTDSATRDARRARNPENCGWAAGDLYFGTRIQLIKDHAKLPDISGGLYCKTASGSALEDARYTDAPAYYFDATASKTYHSSFGLLSPIISLGFYSWQTASDEYRQDDAVVYGFGLQWQKQNLRILASLDGYSGYQLRGDRPAAFRLSIDTKHIRFKYQFGLRDMYFSGFSLGYKINWKAKSWDRL